MHDEQLPQTILIVEDEWTVREVVTLYFEDMGWHLLAVANGEQAIDVLERHAAIGIVFTDISRTAAACSSPSPAILPPSCRPASACATPTGRAQPRTASGLAPAAGSRAPDAFGRVELAHPT